LPIPPEALAAISSAAALVGHEFLKGTAGEAGKSAWLAVKGALGWTSDPPPAEMKTRVEESLATQPELAEKLLEVLKANENPAVSRQVGSIISCGGKLTVIGNVYGGATFN
jgi:hypothetical protein